MTHSVREVADHYGVSMRTVLQWIDNGSLHAVNVARHPGARRPHWRITDDSLQAFEATRITKPAPSRSRRRKPSGEAVEFY
jgi:excisionase family DNA binding protein